MEIKSINDPFKEIRQRPEMYWPTGPSSHNLIGSIVEQLVILGCSNIRVNRTEDWYIVGANDDWLSPILPEGKPLDFIFTNMIPFQEAGVGGAPRVEIFVYDFSESVVAWHEGKSVQLKGKSTNGQLDEIFSSDFTNCTAIAFTGNTYA